VWILAVTGFYSIACASKPDGTLDRQTVMVRARCKQHLQNIKTRFARLSGVEIVTLPNRDYRYRLIIPKAVWVGVLAELAGEQEWSNFKNQVAKQQGKRGAAYTAALHDVWEIMRSLQEL
jgi:hypothetical protein